MTPHDLRRRLRNAPIPDEHEARERSWHVVRAAYAERRPAHTPTSAPRRLAIALAVAAIVLAVVLTPAGAKMVDLVRDAIHPGTKQAKPLTSLPAPGRLLVNSAQGPWVFNDDGSQRLLGAYRDATWSPKGLFVGVTSRDQLTAVEPDGTPHWSLNRRDPRDPRWSPSGFRIAYRTGDSMRVVAGDGTGDHLLARRVAPVAPAWQPLSSAERANPAVPGANVLALATPDGRVEVVQADSRKVLWRSNPGARPVELGWSADRSILVALYRSELRVFSADGELLHTVHLHRGIAATDGAFAPTGESFAVTGTSLTNRDRESSAYVIDLGAPNPRATRPVITDPGTFRGVSWSPNGEWLLVGWRDADEWLFLRPKQPRDVKTAGEISRQFSPGSTGGAFPRPAGWCCTASGSG